MIAFPSSCVRNLLVLITILMVTACDSVSPTDPFSELNSLRLPVETPLNTWLWSSDGAEIYYVNKDGPTLSNTSIRAINVSSHESRILVPDLPDEHIVRFGFGLSADGQHLIYKSHIGENSTPALHRIAVDGNSSPETLFSDVHTDAYAFSPDMSKLAYRNNELGWNEVRILDLDTREAFDVEGAYTDISEIVWSPDGTSILVGNSSSCKNLGNSIRATEFSLIDLASRTFSASQVPCSFDPLGEVSPLSDVVWNESKPEIGVLLKGGIIARFRVPSGTKSDIHYVGTTYGPGAHVGWSPGDQNVTYWQRTCTETRDLVTLEGKSGQECIKSKHLLFYATTDTGESREIVSFETKNYFPSGSESGPTKFSPDGNKIAFKVNGALHVRELP